MLIYLNQGVISPPKSIFYPPKHIFFVLYKMYIRNYSYLCTRITVSQCKLQVSYAVYGEFFRLLDVEGSTFCLHGVTIGIK